MSDLDSYDTCLRYAGHRAPTQGNFYALGFSASNLSLDALVDSTGALILANIQSVVAIN